MPCVPVRRDLPVLAALLAESPGGLGQEFRFTLLADVGSFGEPEHIFRIHLARRWLPNFGARGALRANRRDENKPDRCQPPTAGPRHVSRHGARPPSM